MNSTNLTPIDILKRRKTRLQIKAEALTDILEENFVYLQDNAIPLISETVVDGFISKTPPFVQTLLGKGSRAAECSVSSSPSKFSGIASGALDLLPLFMKGGKGIVAAFLIKKLKKFFFK